MQSYAFLPFLFLKFWFFEAPREMLQFFLSVNSAFMHLFALPLLLRTFFKPLKNEYREGLVGFSRAMGMLVKSVLIGVNLLLLTVLLLAEFCIFIVFVFFPVLSVWFLIL